MSELTAGNNFTYLQLARLVYRKAFHHLSVVLTSAENSGVSVKRARDEKQGKYFYSTIDDSGEDDQSRLLWMFFNTRHEILYKTETLQRAKLNPDEKFDKMTFVGSVGSCESFSINGDVDDEQKFA